MFSKKILLVCIASFAVATLAGKLFDNRYEKRWSTLFFESADSLTEGKINYDIITLGNSRIHFGLNPYFIDSVTGMNSFNFGLGSADIETVSMLSSLYLQQHNPPKLVVLALDDAILTKSERLKTLYHFLFYLNNDTVGHYMKKNDFPAGMINVFPFLKYAFFDEYNRTSLFLPGTPFPHFEHNIYKGFININQGLNKNTQVVFSSKIALPEVWDTGVLYLDNIIRAFTKAGSQVVFLFPPARKSDYKETALSIKSDSIYYSFAKKYKIRIFNFKMLPEYEDKYFVDGVHLNYPGTIIFSTQLGDSLKDYLDHRNWKND